MLLIDNHNVEKVNTLLKTDKQAIFSIVIKEKENLCLTIINTLTDETIVTKLELMNDTLKAICMASKILDNYIDSISDYDASLIEHQYSLYIDEYNRTTFDSINLCDETNSF